MATKTKLNLPRRLSKTQTGAARFVLVTDVLRTWHDAQIYCRQHYTDLAIIQSQTDNDALNVVTPNDDTVWIGMFRDSWKWSDGTNVSAYPINWASTDPDVVGMDPICVAAELDGSLNDTHCSDVYPFICMYNATTATTTTTPITTTTLMMVSSSESKQQILRVEIKSGQNLNDPKQMQFILQWIKQKLTAKGVAITNMTWKTQPDGNVFTIKPEEYQPTHQSCSSDI
ncbi:uncharacterized protein [Misgurnus anguillicaudatus]|uniref:uncharacterized protein n=1 Tax=Misgurnus anguillicaudatus TaxID=75329 RepID=UPI003CCF277C